MQMLASFYSCKCSLSELRECSSSAPLLSSLCPALLFTSSYFSPRLSSYFNEMSCRFPAQCLRSQCSHIAHEARRLSRSTILGLRNPRPVPSALELSFIACVCVCVFCTDVLCVCVCGPALVCVCV